MQFDRKKRFTVLIRSSPNLNKHDLEDRFFVALQWKPRQRSEPRRDYEIGHSQGSLCMPRCKNTSDVFVAPVFTGCNETSNWKFLSATNSYARSPIVCTMHTQSFQSRFCAPQSSYTLQRPAVAC